MQNAETVLDVLRERGRRGLPLDELYRQLFNPQLYLLAYGRIYSNKGAMTPGPDAETADGMTLGKIERIIDALRHERYRFKPVRRHYIPKKDGKQRPLGLPSWSDKLVGEVVRLLLEAYYEPQFSDHSHGYRPARGCHTALREVAISWTGTTWFIEGDISHCFDELDHQVMLDTLGEKIHDNRLLRLIGQMLRAGYLEDWVWNATLSGAPQGGVLSPCLSNIYLDRLDKFVETVLMPGYTRGVLRSPNPEYSRVSSALHRARKRGDHAAVRALRKQQRSLPTGDPCDPGYRRLRYVRYADDILLGFAGPKDEAEEIKRRLAQFLQEDLKLELSETQDADHPRPHQRGAVPWLRDHHPARQPDHHRRPTHGQRQYPAARTWRRDQGQMRPIHVSGKTRAPARATERRGPLDHQPLRGRVPGHRPVLPARRRRPSTRPAALDHGDLATENAGRQVRLVGIEDGPQVWGHHRDAARAAQMPPGQRRPWRGQEAAGRDVRWYPATTAEERGPAGPRTSPGNLPPQGAGPPAPRGTVRALRASGRSARAPDPQTR